MSLINEFTTIPKLLRNVVQHIHDEKDTFLIRKVKESWEEISYQKTLENADAISAYFLSIGIQKGDRIGFILENCPEYIYFDQGLQQIGAINTSIYPTLSESEIEYIINDSGLKVILVGSPFLLKKILKIVNHCSSLIRIITNFKEFDKITDNTSLNAGILNLETLIKEGNQKVKELKT